MHIEGEDTLEHLASSVRLLYDKVREFRTAHPTPADSFLKPALPDVSTISKEPRIIFFRYFADAVRLKTSPKYSESFTGHGWNTAKTSRERGKNVGFCYKVRSNPVTVSVRAS